MNALNLQVKKLDKRATIPTRGSNHSAGYDLYALNSGAILPTEKAIVDTGVAIRIPRSNIKVYSYTIIWCIVFVALLSHSFALYALACLLAAVHKMYIYDLRVYGSIRSRSGLSAKNGIEVGAGVIDFDYSNSIKVILYNLSDDTFRYKAGDRIAQLVLELHVLPDVRVVEELSTISNDNRGLNGFGSTG